MNLSGTFSDEDSTKKTQNHSLSTEETLPTMATLVEVVLPAMDLLAEGRKNQ